MHRRCATPGRHPPAAQARTASLRGCAPRVGRMWCRAQNSRDGPRESPGWAREAVSGSPGVRSQPCNSGGLVATSTAPPTRARRTSREPGFYTRAQVEDDLRLTATELDTFERAGVLGAEQ